MKTFFLLAFIFLCEREREKKAPVDESLLVFLQEHKTAPALPLFRASCALLVYSGAGPAAPARRTA